MEINYGSSNIYRLIPFIAGYISESVSGNCSGSEYFEIVLRESPPNLFLWKKIFELSFKIFEEETEFDSNELTLNEKIDYENKWNDFLMLRESFDVWFPIIHTQWINDRGWISHPDTHTPDESITYFISTTFRRKFKDYLWGNKYKNQIRKMFQQFASKSK